MKKLLFMLLLFPTIAWSQAKNVLSTTRVFPKIDKVLEFEKALAAHAQKYHKGDWHWRVYEIQTGPDVGGYHIIEGPLSWEQFDGRGNLGTEHNNDWNRTVTPLLTQHTESNFSVFQDELSTVAMGDYADKIVISHYFQRSGYGPEFRAQLTKMKKAWEAGQASVAVYNTAASGEPQFALVSRLKQGLKEMASNFRTPLKERFEKIHGADAWKEWESFLQNKMNKQWSELLYVRKDLGSK